MLCPQDGLRTDAGGGVATTEVELVMAAAVLSMTALFAAIVVMVVSMAKVVSVVTTMVWLFE